MKSLLIPLLAAIALPTAVNAFPFSNDNCTNYKYSSSQLFKNKVNSVVVVTTSESQGSGFVVKHEKKNTFILTNAHVVGNKKRVDIKWSDEEKSSGEVIGNLGGYELSKDLALIKVSEKKGKPLKLITTNPEIGSDAVVIGSPSGLEFSLTRGVVSQVREKGDFVQIDAPVNPGNSGGPVFNHAGCVIGIVTFKAGDSSEGLNFAIGNKLISKFINDPFIDEEAINKQTLSNLPPPPLPPLGPFPLFSQSAEHQNPTSKAGLELYYMLKNYDDIANNEWVTLTITTTLRPDKEPKTWRYMIQKKSIRLVDDWYHVDTLKNLTTTFTMVTRNNGQVATSSGYLRPMKVNCKEGIVRTPKNYFTKFKPDNQKPYAENFSGSNVYLTGSGWFLHQAEIDEGKLRTHKLFGNKREVDQMRNTALFNYFCGE